MHRCYECLSDWNDVGGCASSTVPRWAYAGYVTFMEEQTKPTTQLSKETMKRVRETRSIYSEERRKRRSKAHSAEERDCRQELKDAHYVRLGSVALHEKAERAVLV